MRLTEEHGQQAVQTMAHEPPGGSPEDSANQPSNTQISTQNKRDRAADKDDTQDEYEFSECSLRIIFIAHTKAHRANPLTRIDDKRVKIRQRTCLYEMLTIRRNQPTCHSNSDCVFTTAQ